MVLVLLYKNSGRRYPSSFIIVDALELSLSKLVISQPIRQLIRPVLLNKRSRGSKRYVQSFLSNVFFHACLSISFSFPRICLPFSDHGKCTTGIMKKLYRKLAGIQTCGSPVRQGLLMQPAVCDRARTDVSRNKEETYLLDVSAIPARALYQAIKAAIRPKAPPALIKDESGAPDGRCR